MHLHKNTMFLITRRDLLTLGKFSYLIITFMKRKIGAHISMPIKGNVHLLLLVGCFNMFETHGAKVRFC